MRLQVTAAIRLNYLYSQVSPTTHHDCLRPQKTRSSTIIMSTLTKIPMSVWSKVFQRCPAATQVILGFLVVFPSKTLHSQAAQSIKPLPRRWMFTIQWIFTHPFSADTPPIPSLCQRVPRPNSLLLFVMLWALCPQLLKVMKSITSGLTSFKSLAPTMSKKYPLVVSCA